MGFKFVWVPKKGKNTTEDNILLNEKNGQITGLKNILKQQRDTIEDLNSQLTSRSRASMEERAIDLIEKVLVPKNSPQQVVPQTSAAPHEGQRRLDTGVEYSDDQIRSALSQIPSKTLLQLVSSGKEGFNSAVRSKVKDISDTSITRAWEMAIEVVA